MRTIKALEIIVECEKKRKTLGEGSDCSNCLLCPKIKLALPVQSLGPLEDGEITLPVTPCLLIHEILGKVKTK